MDDKPEATVAPTIRQDQPMTQPQTQVQPQAQQGGRPEVTAVLSESPKAPADAAELNPFAAMLEAFALDQDPHQKFLMK